MMNASDDLVKKVYNDLDANMKTEVLESDVRAILLIAAKTLMETKHVEPQSDI